MMNMYNGNSPYKDRLLDLTGSLQIEPNHVGVIFKNGRFADFLEHGRYPPLNPWNTRLVAQVPIKQHRVEAKMEVQSADGFTFNLALSVYFIFDPSQANQRRQAEAVAIVLGPNPNKSIQERVLREAQYGARKVIGVHAAESLLCGPTRNRVERDLRHHLQAVLHDLGVSMEPTNGVLIDALTPPEALARAQIAAYQRRKTIELLEQHPASALQAFLLETLTQPNNVTVFNNRTDANGLLENLYATAFAEHNGSYPLSPDEYRQNSIVYTESPTRSNGNHRRR